jgi:hypothetical protein
MKNGLQEFIKRVPETYLSYPRAGLLGHVIRLLQATDVVVDEKAYTWLILNSLITLNPQPCKPASMGKLLDIIKSEIVLGG